MKASHLIIYLLSIVSFSFVSLNAADIDVRITGMDKVSLYCFFNQKGVTKYESLLTGDTATVKNVEPGEYEVIIALSTKIGYSVLKAKPIKVEASEKMEFAVEPGFVRVNLEMQDVATFSKQELKSGLPILHFQRQAQPKGMRESYEEQMIIRTDQGYLPTSFHTLTPGAYKVFLGPLSGIDKGKWIAAKELVITEEDVKSQSLAVKFTGENVLKTPVQRSNFWPTEER